jgi:outer membrane protein
MTTLISAEFFGGEPGTLQPDQFGTQHNANVNFSATQLIFNGPYIVGLQAASKYKELMVKSYEKSEVGPQRSNINFLLYCIDG